MITVLLFAHLQEEANQNELQIDVANVSVTKLKEHVAKEYNLSLSSNTMVAINEEYANEDDIVQAGDVVAFIPPVSGG
ncbi:molybdenum cofactor biosynthesis protein MoaD [Bacillus manliponensis]|uniref:Molybdopterin synthase sulfur carrier subunit n=1 Tax=Bacillus manliponensis TaxID=574376 RepID=A0A073JW58_9BACI|nr:molybdopterin converting factor subunit 1 [Bacillus manliponensis]KEK18451.1 molybdenum cofactor biosynthesis protein MoaD [Bacillus manliponensis]